MPTKKSRAAKTVRQERIELSVTEDVFGRLVMALQDRIAFTSKQLAGAAGERREKLIPELLRDHELLYALHERKGDIRSTLAGPDWPTSLMTEAVDTLNLEE